MTPLCNPRLHLHRRRLLGAGGGLMLTSLASKLTRASEANSDSGQPHPSVILLWMEGGPSQLETFDPHVGTRFGGDVGDVQTSAPEIRIADTLPNVAEQMHHATLIRSMVGPEGDHERAVYHMKAGYRPDPTLTHPSIGSVLCHADDAGADIPRHVSILPGRTPARGGYLGAQFDAFKTGDPSYPVPDVMPRVGEERYQRRLADLSEIVEPQFLRRRLAGLQHNRTLQAAGTAAARRMMSSDQLTAFDVTHEPVAQRDAFGDHSFGRGVLAAARLIEVGVRCVEVTLGGWDSHVNNHALQTSACEKLDTALAALLRRLDERDLLRSTLVVCGGEFGRTPKHNPAGGRDHWPHGFSTLIAGRNFRRGYVHGQTSPEPNFDKPKLSVSNPVGIADLHATVLASLGLDPSLELDTPIGRPLKRSEGTVIPELLAT
ncbi:MAG: DUF1501 domain-containing protein [Planctomycetota bacterium]